MKLALALAAVLAAPVPAAACACCSDPHTYERSSEPPSFSLEEGLKLEGELGLEIYGERDASIEVGRGKAAGMAGEETIRLTLSRDGKPLGTLSLEWQGKPSYRKTGLDVILPAEDLAKLGRKDMPVYHELAYSVKVTADAALQKALGVAFAPKATFTLTGVSNRCFEPERWILEYAVKKGEVTEPGLGRGKVL